MPKGRTRKALQAALVQFETAWRRWPTLPLYASGGFGAILMMLAIVQPSRFAGLGPVAIIFALWPLMVGTHRRMLRGMDERNEWLEVRIADAINQQIKELAQETAALRETIMVSLAARVAEGLRAALDEPGGLNARIDGLFAMLQAISEKASSIAEFEEVKRLLDGVVHDQELMQYQIDRLSQNRP